MRMSRAVRRITESADRLGVGRTRARRCTEEENAMTWALRGALLAALLPVCGSNLAEAQTVNDVLRSGTCGGEAREILGLANQIARTQMCMFPGTLAEFGGGGGVTVRTAFPFAAPNAIAALRSAAARGPLTVNAALRTEAQAVVMRWRYDNGFRSGCIARPTRRSHAAGTALDIAQGSGARARMVAAGFTWAGASDAVHYSMPGTPLEVQAFQHLWNVNHPEAPLAEDGATGGITQTRMLQSPANGFPIDGCAVDRDGDGSPEGMDCDDRNARNRPGGTEACDNADNDCDARSDEGVARVCGSDVGVCEVGSETCAAGVWGACIGSTPAVAESCDLLDNDCDGEADEAQICAHEDAALARALFTRISSDVDGDGDADACSRTPEGFTCLTSAEFGFDRELRGPRMREGWSELGVYTSVRMGDVDGDAMDDVCAREDDRIVCWGATPVGFVESVRTMPLGTPSPGAQSAEFWLADVDGDALLDPCARSIDGLHCTASGGGEWTLDALSDEAGYADVARHASIRFGDVNGDGSDDVCARDEDGLACWLSTPLGFGRQTNGPAWSDALGWNEPRYGSTIRLVDVDADGRDDACGRGPDGFVCVLANARGWGAVVRGPMMSAEQGFDARSVYATIRTGDVDGDGASDVCARAQDGIRCWLWTGESFGREVRGPALSDAEGWDANARYTTIRLADVSGDGRADLCARASDGLHCWISEGTHFERQWRGSAWSDAHGFADPSITATLTLGGVGGEPMHSLQGGCTCAVHRKSSTKANALLLALAGLLVFRRRRAVSRSAGRSAAHAASTRRA